MGKSRPRTPVRRSGTHPGHARRISTVVVDRVTFGPDSDRGGQQVDKYIVQTDREDNAYSHIVEYKGVEWVIPGKVVDQMVRHRSSIKTELARVRAQETHERLVRQVEVDLERQRDLQGQ